jgi:hypothetical protein
VGSHQSTTASQGSAIEVLETTTDSHGTSIGTLESSVLTLQTEMNTGKGVDGIWWDSSQ